MKFYKCEADYMAIIWADNRDQAVIEYEKTIGEVEEDEEIAVGEIDVDVVFQMMIDGGFDGSREHMSIGQLGELYKTIISNEPIVVLHNCQ